MIKQLWRKFFPKKFKVEIWAYSDRNERKTYYHTLESVPGFTDQEVMNEFKRALEEEHGYKIVFMTKVVS